MVTSMSAVKSTRGTNGAQYEVFNMATGATIAIVRNISDARAIVRNMAGTDYEKVGVQSEFQVAREQAYAFNRKLDSIGNIPEPIDAPILARVGMRIGVVRPS